MAKDPSPLLGYNNNIRHKNRVFHVQTEDSGVRHPHIITHLFMDGGRILKSVKTSYAEHLGVEKMADVVRKMMKDQHKGMLIALRDGQFDVVIDGGEPSKPAATGVAGPPSGSTFPAVPAAPQSQREPVPAVAAPDPPPAPPPPPPPSVPRPVGPTSTERLDIAEFERAAARAPAPLFEPAPTDLQPPPANLFRPRTGGNYSTVVNDAPPESVRPVPVAPARGGSRPAPARPAAVASGRPATVPPGATVSRNASVRPGSPSATPRPGSGSPPRPAPIRRGSSPPPGAADGASRVARRPPTAPGAAARPPESRYASARPAAIFGQAKPRSGSSIFGEDIISDKSLDEVIMSYLADDMGGNEASKPPDPKRRK